MSRERSWKWCSWDWEEGEDAAERRLFLLCCLFAGGAFAAAGGGGDGGGAILLCLSRVWLVVLWLVRCCLAVECDKGEAKGGVV